MRQILLLSHYTKRSGLDGISSSRVFWATSFLNLNDTSEYFYAWNHIQIDALEQTMALLPSEKKMPNISAQGIAAATIQELKEIAIKGDRYGHLYVTSFARHDSVDHGQRGILTPWDRYTKYEGYCLQFAKDDVKHALELESQTGNYELLDFCEIKYGVDKTSLEYKELCFQLSQNLILQIVKSRRDINLHPQFENMWSDTTLYRRLMHYCARHKDPCFSDEREIRILAVPHQMAEPRVFTGIARRKKIHTRPNGNKYIAIGEFWRPGIIPRRIIVGPKANPDIATAVSNYNNKPEIAFSDLPVA